MSADGRIAAEVAAELVDLVEHADGVVGFGALQALNNLAGQRADIGAAMAANFGFIVHAAEGRCERTCGRAHERWICRARFCPRPEARRSKGSGPSCRAAVS